MQMNFIYICNPKFLQSGVDPNILMHEYVSVLKHECTSIFIHYEHF